MPRQMQRLRFDNWQQLDYAALLGRLRSASYCPAESSAAYAELTAGLQALFGAHAVDGRLHFAYDACLYLGPVAR